MDLLAADTTGAALLIGVLSPWIIAIVNRPGWSSQVRGTVAILVSVALGLGVCWQSGTFTDGWQLVATCGTVLATSQACYRRLFPGSQSWLEALTSGRRPAEPEPAVVAEPDVGADVEVVDDEPGRHASDRDDPPRGLSTSTRPWT